MFRTLLQGVALWAPVYLRCTKPTLFLVGVPIKPVLGCIMRTYKNLGYASLRSGFVRVHGDVKVCCAFLGSRVQGVRAGFYKAFLCKAACQHYGVLTFKGSSWQQHQGHAQLGSRCGAVHIVYGFQYLEQAWVIACVFFLVLQATPPK